MWSELHRTILVLSFPLTMVPILVSTCPGGSVVRGFAVFCTFTSGKTMIHLALILSLLGNKVEVHVWFGMWSD